VTQEEVLARVIATIETSDLAYMIVGSFASNYHGRPRMTQDADIVVAADAPKILALAAALAGEFYVSDVAVREAIALRRLFNAVHFETGFKVDVIVEKNRAFSHEELRRRVPGRFAGQVVHFASAEDTVLTKLEWAAVTSSERQYADAAGVIEVQADRLGWEYLERWARTLGLVDLLDAARRGASFPKSK
jgi:hypothetical protein